MDEFRKLGIIEPVLKAIEEEKFDKPTDVQEKSIPLILEGKNVIAGSSTGSGKTLAFSAGIIQSCQQGKGIQALVLTPTRELAEQIYKALKTFSKHKPLGIAAVYGGVSIVPQIDALKTVDVVVGTPGRMLDHISRKTIQLSGVKILVLDEADRMLDMGFIDDVEKIIKQCPKKRQTLLFSATITSDVAYLSQKYMDNAIKIHAGDYVDPKKLKQVYYDVDDKLKFSLLVHLLKNEKADLVMVFCNTRVNTDFVVNNLKLEGVEATAIHGGFTQDKRSRTMDTFHSEKARVLVCTDVAARGLDIKGVSHVYNYDIPSDANDYIHRIGRTARAGKEGKVINILTVRDWENFTRVLHGNVEMDVDKVEVPRIKRIFIKWRQPPRPRGPRRGPPRRGSHRGPPRRGPPRRSMRRR